MSDRTPTIDPELEGRLRTLLADRAATVGQDPPALPGNPVTHLVLTAPHRGRRRGLVVAAAIAASVLVAVGVVVALDGPKSKPAKVVATDPPVPPAPVPTPGREVMAVFHVDDAIAPEAVAREFVRVRLGDGTAATDARLRDARYVAGPATDRGAASGVVPVSVALGGGSGPAPTTTVWVRPGRGGSDVIEASVDGLDLSHVRFTDGHLRGRIDEPAFDDDGRTTTATLMRQGNLPLLDPDAPVRAEAGAPVADTVPLGQDLDLPVGNSSDLELTVRVRDEASGTPIGVATIPLGLAPDREMERIAALPPAERDAAMSELMRKRMDEMPTSSEQPGCVEAGAFRMPELGGFPNEVPSQPATATADVVTSGIGSTPTEAASALGSSLGVNWEVGDVSLSTLDSANVVSRLPGGRLVDLQVFHDDATNGWRVIEVRTRGACRDFGGSGSSRNGVPEPKTTFGVPGVAGAVGGIVWYRTDAGTRRVEVDSRALDSRWVNVGVPFTEITGRATVLRDRDGQAVLVDMSPEINVPG